MTKSKTFPITVNVGAREVAAFLESNGVVVTRSPEFATVEENLDFGFITLKNNLGVQVRTSSAEVFRDIKIGDKVVAVEFPLTERSNAKEILDDIKTLNPSKS